MALTTPKSRPHVPTCLFHFSVQWGGIGNDVIIDAAGSVRACAAAEAASPPRSVPFRSVAIAGNFSSAAAAIGGRVVVVVETKQRRQTQRQRRRRRRRRRLWLLGETLKKSFPVPRVWPFLSFCGPDFRRFVVLRMRSVMILPSCFFLFCFARWNVIHSCVVPLAKNLCVIEQTIVFVGLFMVEQWWRALRSTSTCIAFGFVCKFYIFFLFFFYFFVVVVIFITDVSNYARICTEQHALTNKNNELDRNNYSRSNEIKIVDLS